MKSIYDIIESPLITEKGSRQQSKNKYYFRVKPCATKRSVKAAVEKIYNVTVIDVHTMNMSGKLKRVRYQYGRTPKWKKAVVTLKQGDSIDFTS